MNLLAKIVAILVWWLVWPFRLARTWKMCNEAYRLGYAWADQWFNRTGGSAAVSAMMYVYRCKQERISKFDVPFLKGVQDNARDRLRGEAK